MSVLLNRKKYDNLSDLELIGIYRNTGKKAVIGEIYKRYSHLVYGTALKYLKNTYDSEDLLMNLFELLPGKIKSHEIKNFKSWLYMVTKNESLMLLRKTKREVGLTHENIAADSEDELNIKIDSELKLRLVEQSIEELKDLQKTCIKLFYIEGKSYNQLAEILQIDVKSVKSALQNGKRNLKLILEVKDEFKSST